MTDRKIAEGKWQNNGSRIIGQTEEYGAHAEATRCSIFQSFIFLSSRSYQAI
jgi:hypothetical protein